MGGEGGEGPSIGGRRGGRDLLAERGALAVWRGGPRAGAQPSPKIRTGGGLVSTDGEGREGAGGLANAGEGGGGLLQGRFTGPLGLRAKEGKAFRYLGQGV